MSNYTKQAHVSVAQQAKKNKFDLSHSHITTSDFYCPRPVSIIECEPNCSIKMDLTTNIRLAPLVEPMYGDVKVVNRAFFVPMRTIMAHWNEFITSSPTVSSNGETITINFVPNIPRNVVSQMFYNTLNGLSSGVTVSSEADFSYRQDGMNSLRKLTPKGKAFLNILNGLGYQVDLRKGDDYGSSPYSALPLYAFARICYDWTRNAAYDNYQFLQKYFEVINEQAYNLSIQDLYSILNACYRICYSSDYFTSAWDQPMSPNAGTVGNLSFIDPTNPSEEIFSAEEGSFLSSENTGLISHYGIMMLHKLQDWLSRKQIAGSRALDRYMSEFGVQLESSKMNRCIYLGKQDVPVHIGDVMQTAPDSNQGSSTGYGVGSYSGKGFAAEGSNLCHFSTDEFGYLIVLSYIEPRLSYPYGRELHTMHRGPQDFYTPEFDGLGTQAIRMDEVSAGFMMSDRPEGYRDNAIFGFTPRYAEYKIKHDRLTGDFMLNSRNASLEGWYLTRNLKADDLEEAPIHNHNFTLADAAEFNKIFFDQSDNNDHFFLRYIFNVEKFSQIKPLYDFYQFEDESRMIKQDVGGTQITS